ncbi:MAG: hypothetical protein RBU37_26655 [Myxococcota bacterium]|nr:hypothetical protein [Myxococcota bacterium]
MSQKHEASMHLEFVVDELLLESDKPAGERFQALRRELLMLAFQGHSLSTYAERLFAVLPDFADWRDAIDLVRALSYSALHHGETHILTQVLHLEERWRRSLLRLDFRTSIHPAAIDALLQGLPQCNESAAAICDAYSMLYRLVQEVPTHAAFDPIIPWSIAHLGAKPEGRGLKRRDSSAAAESFLLQLAKHPQWQAVVLQGLAQRLERRCSKVERKVLEATRERCSTTTTG